MANQTHLDILQKGVSAWNDWRIEHPGWTPRLSGTNLTGANLSEAKLTDADLFRADLSRVNLTNADLSGANLTDADLFRADLSRVYLTNADLTLVGIGEVSQGFGPTGAMVGTPHEPLRRLGTPGRALHVYRRVSPIEGSVANTLLVFPRPVTDSEKD